MALIIFIILILLFNICRTRYENINWKSIIRNSNDNSIIYDKENKILITNDKKLIIAKNKDSYYVNNKYLAKLQLQNNNIPTPDMHVWDNTQSVDKNKKIIKKKLSNLLVIKPSHGQQGKNVFTNILQNEILPIINKLNTELNNDINEKIIIENLVHGSLYRIIVVNDTIIGAVKRGRPKVIGNGILTLNELISLYNKNHILNNKYNTKIDYEYISKQNYYLDDIIPYNTIIYISNVINYHNGASTKNIEIKDIHPDNISLFKKINKIFKLNVSGIDYMSKNISNSYKDNGYVIEINGQPGVESNLLVDKQFSKKLINALQHINIKPNIFIRGVSYFKSYFV